MSSSAFARASSQYYTLSSPVNATSNFTAGAYVKTTGLSGGNRYEIMSNESGSSGWVLYVFETGSGNARARFGVFNGGFPETGDFNTIAPGTWYLLVGVRDNTAGELRLYSGAVGGAIGQDGSSDSAGGAPSASGTNLAVGRQPGSSTRYFNGLIFRPFVVFNHVASTTEIGDLSTNLPQTVFGSTIDMEVTRSGSTLTDISPSGFTVTNSGTTEDVDVPIAEGGGGGGGGNPWYAFAQQRQREERLWRRGARLWVPSYA